MMKRLLNIFIFILISAAARLEAIDAYSVQFSGDIPPDMMQQLQSFSELLALQNSPPATPAGLQHRGEADIQNFLRVLHSQAYFNAIIKISYDFNQDPALVIVNIDPGPIYPIADFAIIPAENSPQTFPYDSIDLCDLGIFLGTPAIPRTILEAEDALLLYLAKKGYPLAVIEKREVLADQHLHAVFVTLHVNSQSLAFFGPTLISGNGSVREEFLRNKINWQEGEPFNTKKIERTQAAIEATGLFSSISINHANSLNDCQQLPIEIELIEGKHRSIGWGLTYATERGPGVSFEWEHRNIAGAGEKLRFDLDLWFDTQDGRLLYVKPDFLPGQDFLWTAEAKHENTKGFHETSFSLSGIIEKQINRHVRLSYGGMYKILHDTHADLDGQYNLFKIPFYLRINRTDNILDPTHGSTLLIRSIPSWQFLDPQFVYCINTIAGTTYYALTSDNQYIFAIKGLFGTILGSNRRTIPTSERFYEGSDTTLRGYRYETVSPLDHHHKPTGGRSVLACAFELRVRATENFGWVAFYEIGNVYANPFPELSRKVLQSVGYGIRYHTPVGPLRLDFAVPLNPRRHVDNRFEIYLSIGQAF